MKIAAALRDVTTSEDMAPTAMSIVDFSKIFAILIDLYGDKALAVVRETVFNAYDANPQGILISVPNPIEPAFMVRDFGPGMSPEFMRGGYTQVGHSTKSGSNDDIGGFGLGRLSPLAYTDTYSVTSIHRGTKSVYTVYRGDANIPQVVCLTASASDEPSGVEVKVPIKQGDFQVFKQRANDVCKWFPTDTFETYGFTVEPPEITLRTPKWLLRPIPQRTWNHTTGTYNTLAPIVLMGPAAYGLDWSKVPDCDLPPGIVPIFNVGEVDILPSREALSYDPTTIRTLQARHAEIVYEFVTEAMAQITAMKPLARLAFIASLEQAQMKPLFEAYQKANGLWGVNRPIDGHGHFFKDKLEKLVIDAPWRRYERSYRSRGKTSTKFSSGSILVYIKAEQVTKPLFLFNDMTANKTPQMFERVEASGYQDNATIIYPSPEVPDLKAFRALVPELPDASSKNLSEIYVTPRVTTQGARVEMRIYVSAPHTGHFYEDNVVLTGGVYIPYTNTAPDGDGGILANLKWHDEQVLGLTKKAQSKVDLTKFTHLRDHLVAKAKRLLKDPTFLRALHQAEGRNLLSNNETALVEELARRSVTTPFLRLLANKARIWREDERLLTADMWKDIHVVKALANRFELVKLPTYKDRSKIKEGITALLETNPLLSFVFDVANRVTSLSFTGEHDTHLKGLLST